MKHIGLITKAAGAALVLAASLMTGCGSDSGSSSTKKALPSKWYYFYNF